jgi:hypothetical protein
VTNPVSVDRDGDEVFREKRSIIGDDRNLSGFTKGRTFGLSVCAKLTICADI